MVDERELLLQHLTIWREHALGILEDLSEDQLRRPLLPSGWSCLGMIKHLALGDEHYWFRCVMDGEPFDFRSDLNAEWQVAASEGPKEIFGLYRLEIEAADRVIMRTPVDTAPRQPDPDWGEWGARFSSLRSVMLHVIGETAVHTGHLDAVRELIDKRQWIVL